MPKHYQKQQQLQQQISKTTELEFTLEAFCYCVAVPIVFFKIKPGGRDLSRNLDIVEAF
jgi:hypothetical protein